MSVTGLEITIDEDDDPPTAEARFNSRISYEDRRAEVPHGNYFGGFVIWLERHDGRWLVVGHERKEVQL